VVLQARLREELRPLAEMTRRQPLVLSPVKGPAALLRKREGTFDFVQDLLTARGVDRFLKIQDIIQNQQAFDDPKFFEKTEDVLSPLEQHIIYTAWTSGDEDQLEALSSLTIEDYKQRGDVPRSTLGQTIKAATKPLHPYQKMVLPISEQAERVPFAGPTLKREIEFAPITLPLTVFGPTRLMLAGLTGTIAAGTTARAFTDDEKIITTAEIAGGVAPFAPGSIKQSLNVWHRFRPIETAIKRPVVKGSTVRFSAPGEGQRGNWVVVDQNKKGFVLRRPNSKRIFEGTPREKRQATKGAVLTRVQEDDLIHIMQTVRKPEFLLADDFRRMAEQQIGFGRPDNAALYTKVADHEGRHRPGHRGWSGPSCGPSPEATRSCIGRT
jgi:hypothetical protein